MHVHLVAAMLGVDDRHARPVAATALSVGGFPAPALLAALLLLVHDAFFSSADS